MLKPSTGPDESSVHPPSPPPPSPTGDHLSMSASREHAEHDIDGCDTPSDDELHAYGSPSLVGTVPPHLATTRTTQKPDADSCCGPQGSVGGAGLLRKRLLPAVKRYNPTLTLENAGSVARDHLASERTFLAYVRTSLTIASTGVGACSMLYGGRVPSG